MDVFLETLESRGYKVILYTAGTSYYVKMILPNIPKGYVITKVYHREHCDDSGFKDLSFVKKDFKGVVLDDLFCFCNEEQNKRVLNIKKYLGDKDDNELVKILDWLRQIEFEPEKIFEIIEKYNNK